MIAVTGNATCEASCDECGRVVAIAGTNVPQTAVAILRGMRWRVRRAFDVAKLAYVDDCLCPGCIVAWLGLGVIAGDASAVLPSNTIPVIEGEVAA